MAHMWKLRSSLWLPKTIEEVFPFFADAKNLETITPKLLRFSIVTPQPIDMHKGTLIDYKLRIRGIPARWRTHIAEWDPPRCFADEQLKGPYVRWYHRHLFEEREVDGVAGTDVLDEVEIVPPGGPLAPLLFRWIIRGDVQKIFQHRTKVLCEHFGGDPEQGLLTFVKDDIAADPPPATSGQTV